MERRVLTLTPDYAAPSPLWNQGGACLDLTGIGLPTELAAALLRWQRHFDEHFRPGPGWSSRGDRQWHLDEGAVLRNRLATALPGYEITLDLWAADQPE